VENRAAVRAAVITELSKIREGKITRTEGEMKKFIRDILDEKWSRRYVYAAIEAALWATGVATIIFRPEAVVLPNLPGHPMLFTPDKSPIPPGLKNQYVNMSNTIWETVSHMFPGASDAVIMAKSKVLMAAIIFLNPNGPPNFLVKLVLGRYLRDYYLNCLQASSANINN